MENAKFNMTSFCVQVHSLQIRRMKRDNVEAIAKTLGRVECVEESEKGDYRGRCMRVQVNIDIT